jgi:hypothetical protein
MLLPMVQFFVTLSPDLQGTVLTDPSLPRGPFVLESLVEIQMVLPILSGTHKKLSTPQPYSLFEVLPSKSHDRDKLQGSGSKIAAYYHHLKILISDTVM